MKKIITAMLICVVMLIGVMPFAMADASDVVFDIVPNKTDVNPGDTVTYTIYVTAAKAVSGWQFYLDIPEGMTYVASSGAVDSGLKTLLNDAENNIGDVSYTESMKMFIANTGALEGFNPENFLGKKVTVGTFQCTVNSDAVGAQAVGLEFEVLDDADLASYLDGNFTVNKASVSVICEHPSYAEVVDAKYIVSSATCEDAAVYYKSCSVCGEAGTETFVAQDTALGHDWGDWTQTTAPTCSAVGEETRVCANDAEHKEYRDVAIDETAHTWGDWTQITAPTCSAVGEEIRVCANDADHTDKRDVAIDETAHTWGDWTQTTAPTCSAKGEETRVCVNDANHTDKRDVEIDADAHTWGDWTETTAPTCSAKGEETRVCVNDAEHKEYRDVAINPTAHKWGDWVETTAPTCSAEGEKERVCEYDADHKESGTVPVDPAAHNNNAVVTAPTCTEQGYTTYTCANGCGHSYLADYVDAKGHTDDPESESWNWSADYSEASCTMICDVCDVSTTVKAVIEVGSSTAKDCTEVGKTTYVAKATVNGKEYTDEKTVEGAAGPHDWSDWTVTTAPTCTEQGEETRVCKLNDEHKDTRPVDALGHDYKGVVTAPTCTEQGYTTYTCANNSEHSYVDDYVDALGHDYKGVVTEPTCTEQGYTTYTCANNCGDSYVDDYVDPLGHTEKTSATCASGAICNVCGEEYGEKDPANHSAISEVKEVPSTCTTPGTKAHWACEGCGKLYADANAAEEITDPKTLELPLDPDNHTMVYKYDDNNHWLECADGDSSEKDTASEPHTMGDWHIITNATGSKDGLKEKYCDTCEYTVQEKIPATGSGSSSDKDNSDIPDTGDDSPIVLLLIVTVLCATSVLVLTTKKRKD